MKREEHNLDQHFRDGLRDYASPLAANLWDKLDAAREEEKKSRRIIWWKWALGTALLILLTSSSIFYFNSQKEDSKLPPANINFPTASNSSIEQNPQSENLPESNPDLTTKELTRVEEISKNEGPSDLNLNLPNVSSKKVDDQDEVSISNNELRKTNIKNDKNNSTIKNPIIDTFEKNKNLGNTNIDISTTSSQAQKTKLENTTPIATTTESEKPEKLKTTQRLAFLKTNAVALIDETSDFQTLLTAPPINLFLSKGPKGCYSFAGGRIKYDYFVDAFISPEYSVRKLSARTTEDEPYRQRRDETETTLFGVSGGVRLSVVTRRGLALRTGIVYNRILERFRIEKEGDMRTIIDVDTETMDTISITVETGTTVVRTFNRYHSIDIPLLLGYEIETNKFNFNINSGVYFNIYARQRGEILSPTDMRATITSNNPQRIPAFEKDFGISIFGSLGINYRISPEMHFLVEPNIRYQLKSITLDAYPLEQQYINFGVLLGVRRQF